MGGGGGQGGQNNDTCIGLTSPHSRPNLRLSVSVSRRIAEDASAAHSSVPSRRPGLPHPHAGGQRNGGRSRCDRGAARRKRSLSRILPLPASSRHCRLMRHISVEKGVWNAAERRRRPLRDTSRNREGHHDVPPPPHHSPFPPGGSAGELKQLYLRGGDGRDGGISGGEGGRFTSPSTPASAEARKPRSLYAAGSYLHFVTKLARFRTNMEPRRRAGEGGWGSHVMEGGLQAPRDTVEAEGWERGGSRAARAAAVTAFFSEAAAPPLPPPPSPSPREPWAALWRSGPFPSPRAGGKGRERERPEQSREGREGR